MSNSKEVRWNQRFRNFDKAFLLLTEAKDNFDSLNDLCKEGFIHRFEATFELSWKVLKDYLEANGITSQFPRDVIKNAFHTNLIDNGEVWMEMLEKRNILTHTYIEENFLNAIESILNDYYNQLKLLHSLLYDKL